MGSRYRYMGPCVLTMRPPCTNNKESSLLVYVHLNFVPIVNQTRGVSLSVLYRLCCAALFIRLMTMI